MPKKAECSPLEMCRLQLTITLFKMAWMTTRQEGSAESQKAFMGLGAASGISGNCISF